MPILTIIYLPSCSLKSRGNCHLHLAVGKTTHFFYIFSSLKKTMHFTSSEKSCILNTMPIQNKICSSKCKSMTMTLFLLIVQVVVGLSTVYPKDMEAPSGGVDDMTKLSYLHEPGVLQNLSIRYQLNEIYVCPTCSHFLHDDHWHLAHYVCKLLLPCDTSKALCHFGFRLIQEIFLLP